MKKILFSIFYLLSPFLFAQKNTTDQYIEQYKNIAIREMKHYGIPASITLAQGILESDNGNSPLAVKARNHFGIKCTSDWDGRTFHYDDDRKNECFRKYKHDEDSYTDHTEFLRNRPNYAFLFGLDRDDYKGWAKGLKKAGYATNPKYPQLLINLIEKYKLYAYDGKGGSKPNDENLLAGLSENNSVKFVRVKNGETLFSIADQYNLSERTLRKYNDLPKRSLLKTGDRIYVEQKRKRGKEKYHIVDRGETMHFISQEYGIRLKKLYRRNRMSAGTEAATGERLNLRGKRTSPPRLADEIVPPQEIVSDKKIKSLPKYKRYAVKKGDTLYSVSKKYGLTVPELKNMNQMDTDDLEIGQVLIVGY